jgi:hypothetical protein
MYSSKRLAELRCEIAESAAELREMLRGHEKGQFGYVLNNVAVPLSDVRTYSMLGPTFFNAKLEDLKNIEKDKKLFKKGSKERELIVNMKNSLNIYIAVLTSGNYGDREVAKYYERVDSATRLYWFNLTGAATRVEGANQLVRDYVERNIDTLLDEAKRNNLGITLSLQHASIYLAEGMTGLDIAKFGENHEVEALKEMREYSKQFLKAIRQEIPEEQHENEAPGDRDAAA